MVRFRAGKALILALLFFALRASAVQGQESYRVIDVVVEGNHVTSASLILGVASISKGSNLTQSIIENSMHRLWGLGIFSDVRIEAEDIPGGLRVYIVVKELPKLTGLKFAGNHKFKDRDLKDKLGLGVGGYISPYLMLQKAEKIKDLYAEKGYFRAEVIPELSYNTDSTEAQLTYRIDEKSKVKVEKVVLTGNERVPAGELIHKMRNRKRGFLKSSDFAQDQYEDDLKKIIAEYHNRGFIDAYMVSDSFTIDTTRNRMTIFLQVYEGPEYYFGDVTFKSTEALPPKVLRKLMKFRKGDVFSQEKYDESLGKIYTTYQEIGHLHVRVDDERETVNDSIINITYDITEGLPSHVNLVRIVGNTKTKDRVIRRELKLLPGQVFNRSLLVRSVRDVMALNYFANAVPDIIPQPSGDVDIEFKVEEKQTGQISAGAGYNSQDKLVGSLGMGIPNFRGMGQNLSFNVEFGSRRNSFSTSFTEPWLFGRPTLLGLDVFLTNRRWFTDYTEGRQGGSVRLGRRLNWPDNYTSASSSIRIERNRFFDFDDAYIRANSFRAVHRYTYLDTDTTATKTILVSGEPFPGTPLDYGEKWNAAIRWSVNLTRDSRNLPEFATKGSLISYTFENTGGVFGGFWNYRRHRFSAAKFVPLLWKFALAAKIQWGAISSSSDDPNDERVLLSDRFTPGGTAFDGIVRGYDDGTLTPDSVVTFGDTTYFYSFEPDSTGTPDPSLADSTSRPSSQITTRVRGKYMLVSNLEIQFPIAERSIYGLLFFDAGNSWLHFEDINLPKDLYSGYGVGFRVVVPGIGTIGFDFAYPLNKVDGQEQKWRPHFQIGTTFR